METISLINWWRIGNRNGILSKGTRHWKQKWKGHETGLKRQGSLGEACVVVCQGKGRCRGYYGGT